MKRIVFATNNQHKLQEIRDILGSDYEVVSLKEIECDVDIPETGNTLEENALQKAQYVYDHYHVSCFADDTGLEVEALDGAPGVHSARYAEGTDHDSEANMAKLLRELDGKENRQAAVAEAEIIIDAGVQSFMHWIGQRDPRGGVVELIRDLHAQTDEWRAAELARARKLLARGDDVDSVLEALARGLTQKMLHGALAELHTGDAATRQATAQTVERLFLRGQNKRNAG